MRLDELLGDVEVLDRTGTPAPTAVTAVVHATGDVVPGALFCCLRGARVDGHDLAPAAVAAGASAVLCERVLPVDVPQVVVRDVRAAMARVAAAFHGHPSRALTVVGVTGTNGKTTTTHMIAAVLAAAGREARVLGTLSGLAGPPTTPDAPALQSRLAAFRDEGAEVVAMEVSSHALAQRRVDATRFAVAVFTNLSQDHLEFHGTMEEYFRAKARLFEPDLAALAVVNADDDHGRRLLGEAPVPMRAFSLADAQDLRVRLTSSEFRWRGADVRLPLGGRFNVSNALAAATVAEVLGVDPETVARGLSSVPTIAGRFESVDAGQPFAVIVDYAHTPDGLEQVLQTARAGVGDGRVIIVFGCGGERDRGKRPLMGRVATHLADLAVLTSDNPRSEDPWEILDEVRQGAAPDAALIVEEDRRAAIGVALDAARPGDVVVIAGKGHETGQVVGDRVLPFDDRVVARELLEAGRGSAA